MPAFAPSTLLRRSLLPLLSLLLIAAAACTSNQAASPTDTPEATETPTTAPTSTAAPTAIPAPQTLRVRLTGEPSTLDPQRLTDVASITMIRSLSSSLLRIDEEQRLQPDLALEVPTIENGGISEDGLTYTFRLRVGLRWSDGSDLVAQDLVNGARRLFEPGSGNFYADFYRMLAAGGAQAELLQAQDDDVEGDALVALEQAVADKLEVFAPDDRTVVYRLNKRSPVFLPLTALWALAPVRQDLIDAHGDAWIEAGTYISNGPFALSDWEHTQSVTLEKNPFWHGAGPALDEIRFDIIGDDAIAFLAYREGELDIVSVGPTELVQIRGSDLEDEFQSYAQLSTIGVFFNFDVPELGDLEVREALAGGFDREEFAEIVSEGGVLAAYAYLPPGLPGYDPQAGLQFRDAVPRSRQLLEDAGYPGGEGLTLELLTANVTSARTRAEWLKEQWERNLGVSIELTIVEPSNFVENLLAGNWALLSGSWTADYPDPQNWLPPFRSGGGLSVGHFDNAEYDALIDEADGELDEARRIALYQQAQRILLDEVGFSPVFYARRNVLVKPWVDGFVPSAMAGDSAGDGFFDRVSISGRE